MISYLSLKIDRKSIKNEYLNCVSPLRDFEIKMDWFQIKQNILNSKSTLIQGVPFCFYTLISWYVKNNDILALYQTNPKTNWKLLKKYFPTTKLYLKFEILEMWRPANGNWECQSYFYEEESSCILVIHKILIEYISIDQALGSSINHVVNFWYFDPPSLSWSLLLN